MEAWPQKNFKPGGLTADGQKKKRGVEDKFSSPENSGCSRGERASGIMSKSQMKPARKGRRKRRPRGTKLGKMTLRDFCALSSLRP